MQAWLVAKGFASDAPAFAGYNGLQLLMLTKGEIKAATSLMTAVKLYAMLSDVRDAHDIRVCHRWRRAQDANSLSKGCFVGTAHTVASPRPLWLNQKWYLELRWLPQRSYRRPHRHQ